ncbi:MAG: hypothetical protein ACE3JQ_07585 [Paenisporosarcina sp.]
MSQYEQMMQDLKEGLQSSFTISKEEFLTFREVLIAREDFKHFKGVAKQGGSVVYTYEIVSRS